MSPEPWIRQIQPLTSALCTMAVLVLEEHGGVCSHWQAVTSKEEEGQSKAKYPLQFILFTSPCPFLLQRVKQSSIQLDLSFPSKELSDGLCV